MAGPGPPLLWGGEPAAIGIDEAGRGPVLGSMVYAACYAPAADLERVAGLGFKDSKDLTEERRAELRRAVETDPRLAHAVRSVSARDISARMLQAEKTSLNVLAIEATFGVIQDALDAGAKLVEGFVDTLGDPDRHRERLERKFPGIKFTVCKKADSLYPIVSAASIVAKTTRDWALRACDPVPEGVPISKEFGSGYPSDPLCKQWLVQNLDPLFGFPSVVRFSWKPARDLIEERAAVVEFEADLDEEEDKGQRKLSFGAKPGPPAPRKRHSYFSSRNLKRTRVW